MDGARRAERDGLCYRELPVSMLDGDVLLEGVADLAFEVDGAITVVDFKTDRAMAPALDGYVRQVALYAEAISLATGRPARARLAAGLARMRVLGSGEASQPRIEIANGLLQHRAVGRGARQLQIGQCTRAREQERCPLRLPGGIGRGARRRGGRVSASCC